MSSSPHLTNYAYPVLAGYAISLLSAIFVIYVTAEGWLW